MFRSAVSLEELMNLDTSLVTDKKAYLFDIGQLSCYVSYDTLPTEQLVIG